MHIHVWVVSIANINKSKQLLMLIQGKLWPKKMFSDALLSSGIPESHQIQIPREYEERAGVEYLRYDVKGKSLPWDLDRHKE